MGATLAAGIFLIHIQHTRVPMGAALSAGLLLATDNRRGSQWEPHSLQVFIYLLTTDAAPIGDRTLCRYVYYPLTTDAAPIGDRSFCRYISNLLMTDVGPIGDRACYRYFANLLTTHTGPNGSRTP